MLMFTIFLSSHTEYIWAQHVNGEMVIFSPEARHFKMVSQPSITNHFICISASEDSLWGLATNGTIYVRSAVRSSCPEGINWVRLDLEQLGMLTRFYVPIHIALQSMLCTIKILSLVLYNFILIN